MLPISGINQFNDEKGTIILQKDSQDLPTSSKSPTLAGGRSVEDLLMDTQDSVRMRERMKSTLLSKRGQETLVE